MTEPAQPATAVSGDRVAEWKRHLLDLSNYNRLLNFKDGSKNAPLLCHDIAELEDGLSENREYRLLPRREEIAATETDDEQPNPACEDFQAGKLRLDLTQAECDRRLLAIYREARNAMLESGGNLLYVALGFLHWQAAASEPVRRAPLILLPVEMRRQSGGNRFTLRAADDEARVNTTLLELLRQDFGVTLSDLDPLPRDEHGIDVKAVLEAFSGVIESRDGWFVEPSCALGLFTFTKYLMWRDMEQCPELLAAQPLVMGLIQRRPVAAPASFPREEDLDADLPPEKMFCPLSADSSQLAAIQAAASGQSFVLNGPPGTGKSQSIANMIAHCLALGKTVLFVAEKAAALGVVQSRLRGLGLGHYCLELHSRKAQKREVIAQLKDAWQREPVPEPSGWAAAASELAALRARLNRHCDALHRLRPVGRSLFWGVAKCIAYEEKPALAKPLPLGSPPEKIAASDAAAYDELCARARDLETAAGSVDRVDEHPWRRVAFDQWKPGGTRRRLAELLEEGMRSWPLTLPVRDAMRRFYPQELAAGSAEALPVWEKLAEAFAEAPGAAPALVLDADAAGADAFLEELAEHVEKRDAATEQVLRGYRDDFLEMNLRDVAAQLDELAGMNFISRFFARRRLGKTLEAVRRAGGKTPDVEQVRADVAAGLSAQEERRWLADHGRRAEELLGRRDAAAADIRAAKKWAGKFREAINALSGFAGEQGGDLRRLLAETGCDRTRAGDEARRLNDALAGWRKDAAAWLKCRGEIGETLQPDAEWWAGLERGEAKKMSAQLGNWHDHLDMLPDWSAWRRERAAAVAAGLEPLVAEYERGGVAADSIFDRFDASWCRWWAEGVLGGEPDLAEYPLTKLQADLARFSELDAAYGDLVRDEVRARLAKRAADARQSADRGEMSFLTHQMGLKRAHQPIRRLMRESGRVIRGMMPCFLMSPISVAQYLEPDCEPFDLVIFDEASQIPTWDAVGVMARGRQVVVAGDPMQLPPTNFFQRAAESADVDDNAYQDLESVLDDCLAASLGEVYLKWHYRSRNEALIAFSNREYYGGRLFTFPGPDRAPGVSLRMVPGVYGRSGKRTNPVEAQAVVDEILRRLDDPVLRDRSIGVVTLNQAQQELVEDLLDAARKGRRDLDKYFDVDQPDSVLIKNLENVQGDERDVMLMSVCYGPDAEGKVGVNFGPLNRLGGERRLNVAVTRARYETIVFSSMTPEQIDLGRTRSVGARHLREYLEYARSGPGGAGADAARMGTFPSGLEAEVAEVLRGRGYEVVGQVGCSSYRVDLGVVNPDAPESFLMGIEGDGDNYRSGRTARDRDVLRANVLRGLGWRLGRVWSEEWFEHREAAEQKLLTAVDGARVQWRKEHTDANKVRNWGT